MERAICRIIFVIIENELNYIHGFVYILFKY